MTGTSYRRIVALVAPLALAMVNNAVMQFVDRAFLSRESMESLEAALPASMLALLVVGFFQSVVSYSGTFVAQYRGAGDRLGMAASARAGTLLALVSGVLVLLSLPLGSFLLPFASTNPDVLAREWTYYSILTVGGMAFLGQSAASSVFTGLERTRTVFLVNLFGNLLNVALDAILIFGWRSIPAFGIAGAAWATVASAAAQWGAFAILSRGVLAKAEKGSVFRTAARILRFGIPAGAYSVLNFLSFTVFVFVTGRVGDVAFAVSNAAFSVNYLLIAPMEGFAIGAATLVGAAQGRGDSKAAQADGERTLCLALALVAVLSLAAVVFCHPILDLFAPTGESCAEFHSTGFVLFVLMAAWQLFDAADVVLSGALKGAGDTRFVMAWMLVVAFGFWLPLVFVVAAFHNTMPALWATMIAYVAVISAGTLIRWRRGSWRSLNLVNRTRARGE